MISILGQTATPQGFARQVDLAGDADLFTMPATAFRPLHRPDLPLLMQHSDWQVGDVRYLERSRSDGLLALATIEDDTFSDLLADGPWYLSAGVRATPAKMPNEYEDIRLKEISLTRRPAVRGTRPLVWSHHDVTKGGGGQPSDMALNWRSAWDRGAERLVGARFRVAPKYLVIHDLDPLPVAPVAPAAPAALRSVPSTVEAGRAYRRTYAGGLRWVDEDQASA